VLRLISPLITDGDLSSILATCAWRNPYQPGKLL